MRWFGHAKGRKENYVGRKMLSMVPPGMRGRRAPEATLGGHHQRRHAVCWCKGGRHARKRDLEHIYICCSKPILNGRSLKKTMITARLCGMITYKVIVGHLLYCAGAMLIKTCQLKGVPSACCQSVLSQGHRHWSLQSQ